MLNLSIRVLFWFLLVFPLSGCGFLRISGSSQAVQLPPEAHDLAHLAHTVVGATAELSQVWSGFWPHDQGFVLYSPDGALLLSSGAAPAEFQRVRAVEHLRAFWHDGPHPQLTHAFVLGFQTPSGDVPGMMPRAAPGAEFDSIYVAALLFHEAFHAFQDRAFAGTQHGGWHALEEPTIEADRIGSPTFLALADVERALLADALVEQRPDQTVRLLREYASIRRMRMKLLPPMQQLAEAHLERKEASAHWVGYAAALTAVEGTQDRLPLLLHADLVRSSNPIEPTTVQGRHRTSLYASGASLAYLFERIGVIDWQHRVQSGATFQDLLAQTVALDTIAAESLAAIALLRYGFEQRRLQRSEEVASAVALVSEDSFRSAERTRVSIHGFRLSRVESAGTGSYRLASGATIYPATSSLRIYGADGAIEVHGAPTLLDHHASEVIVLVSKLPDVQGLGADPSEMVVANLEISFTAGSIDLQTPVRLRRTGNSLSVTVLDP